jgi:glutathione S-transferase
MPTYKVALMLSLVGERFDWNRIDILAPDFRRGERSPEFLQISRFGQIPALTDRANGQNFIQSNVILTYLSEETRCFLPALRCDRVRAQEWLAFEAGRLFEGFAGVRFLSRYAEGDRAVIEHYRNYAHRHLGFLNDALEARQWLVADEPSVADIAVFALTSYASEIDVNLQAAYPAVARWHGRMRCLPGYAPAEELLGA